MIFLKNGRIIDPSQKLDHNLNILIKDGYVNWIGEGSPFCESDVEIYDLEGKILVPGLIDPHVHFRDPGLEYKETIETGCSAAVAGGFTSVIAMANTKPAVDNVDTLSYVLDKGRGCQCNFYSVASVTKALAGKNLTPMEDLARSGAIGFSDDGLEVEDPSVMLEAFKRAGDLGKIISVHCEDPRLCGDRTINHGSVSCKLGLYGVPALAEESMIQRDILIASKTGARVHIQHISSAIGVEMVRRAKSDGVKVTSEVTPHHLVLTEGDVLKYGTMAKMSPPLRREEDRIALIEGLKDGTIDMIATDHAPHSLDEKSQGMLNAPNGIIGLETAFPVIYTDLVERGLISLPTLIDKMSCSPARVWEIGGGSLSLGAKADIAIIDCQEKYEISPDSFKSKGRNCPFRGKEVMGRVSMTFVGGERVF